jgi:N-hydroxyarylamine O-acetyltransferase
MSFDLDAYLARIRLAEAPAADADGLATVQRAQRLAIPFENLDIRLGRGIRIDSDSVFAKLVTGKRGGYCFEQNRLFADALATMGFVARPLLARVLLGATEAVTPLTHMLLLVTIDGQDWIADAGFGGSYAPPMPLVSGAEATAPDGALFRLVEDGQGWLLNRNGPPGATDGRGGSGPVDQYRFRLTEVAQADLDMSNHWTATAPGTRFVEMAIVSIALPGGYAALNDRKYGRHASGEDVMAEITDPRVYRLRLSMMFGIDLSAEEVAQLGLF